MIGCYAVFLLFDNINILKSRPTNLTQPRLLLLHSQALLDSKCKLGLFLGLYLLLSSLLVVVLIPATSMLLVLNAR